MSEDGDFQSCDIPGFPVDAGVDEEEDIGGDEESEEEEGFDADDADKVRDGGGK